MVGVSFSKAHVFVRRGSACDDVGTDRPLGCRLEVVLTAADVFWRRFQEDDVVSTFPRVNVATGNGVGSGRGGSGAQTVCNRRVH